MAMVLTEYAIPWVSDPWLELRSLPRLKLWKLLQILNTLFGCLDSRFLSFLRFSQELLRCNLQATISHCLQPAWDYAQTCTAAGALLRTLGARSLGSLPAMVYIVRKWSPIRKCRCGVGLPRRSQICYGTSKKHSRDDWRCWTGV